MSKTVRIVAAIGVIFLAVMALTHRSQRSRTTAALTAYKAELRAQGEQLTAAELGFPRPPEASRDLDLLVAGVNRIAAAPFDPSLLELMHFVSADRAEVAWAQSEVRASSARGSNTNPGTWEVFPFQFETAADALRDIRDATQIPPRYFCKDRPISQTSPTAPKLLSCNCAKPPSGWWAMRLLRCTPANSTARVRTFTRSPNWHSFIAKPSRWAAPSAARG